LSQLFPLQQNVEQHQTIFTTVKKII